MATINTMKSHAWHVFMEGQRARMETARILALHGTKNITGAMADAAMPKLTAARQAQWRFMEDATREFEETAKRGRPAHQRSKNGSDLRQQITDAVADLEDRQAQHAREVCEEENGIVAAEEADRTARWGQMRLNLHRAETAYYRDYDKGAARRHLETAAAIAPFPDCQRVNTALAALERERSDVFEHRFAQALEV